MKFLTTIKNVLNSTTVEELFDDCNGKENQACIADAPSPVFSSLSKHNDLKYQFLEHHIRNGNVKIWYVPREGMVADISSKT